MASTFAESLKDGIFALSDLNSIKILEFLRQGEEGPAAVRESLDLKKGKVRWRLEWLEAIGMIREVPGEGRDETVYRLSERDFLIYSGYSSNPLIQTDFLVLFSL